MNYNWLQIVAVLCIVPSILGYNVCLNRPDNTLMNDYSECSKYFECIAGEPQQRECRAGFIFSQELGGCTRCYTCPKEGVMGLPVPQSCTEYVLCKDGQPIYRECPFGTHWNEVLQNCDVPENANCIEHPTPKPTPPPEPTTIPPVTEIPPHNDPTPPIEGEELP